MPNSLLRDAQQSRNDIQFEMYLTIPFKNIHMNKRKTKNDTGEAELVRGVLG
jgi:hypothetical protein